MDLAQTFWEAFDKKQPDYREFIDWLDNDENEEIIGILSRSEYLELDMLKWIFKFNNQLQKEIIIEMLVAVKDGQVLEAPMTFEYRSEHGSTPKYPQEHYESDFNDYQKAMKSVLYEDVGSVTVGLFKTIKKTRPTIQDWDGFDITLNWWKEVLSK